MGPEPGYVHPLEGDPLPYPRSLSPVGASGLDWRGKDRKPGEDPPRYDPLPGQLDIPFPEEVPAPPPPDVGAFKVARKRRRARKSGPVVGQLSFLDTWTVEVVGADEPIPPKAGAGM